MKNPLFLSSIAIALLLGMATALVFLNPAPVQLQAATWFGEQARPLPEFELQDHSGQAFNPSTLQGKWQLLFFGYTHCPDICPDTLQMLTRSMQQISQPQVLENLQISLVSVDPERDSRDNLRDYVTYFDPRFKGVRGEMDEINKLTDALGILHYITKSDDGSTYEVAHSGVLTLINPEGRYTAVFNTPHDPGKIAADLTTLIQG